jgi:hypothetical protein
MQDEHWTGKNLKVHGKSCLGNSQKCVAELETICINRMCVAMGGGGGHSVNTKYFPHNPV